jgi:hypothetical protein
MRDADCVPEASLQAFIARGLRQLQKCTPDAVSHIYMAPGIEKGILREKGIEDGALQELMGMRVHVDDLIPPGTIFMSPVALKGYPE